MGRFLANQEAILLLRRAKADFNVWLVSKLLERVNFVGHPKPHVVYSDDVHRREAFVRNWRLQPRREVARIGEIGAQKEYVSHRAEVEEAQADC